MADKRELVDVLRAIWDLEVDQVTEEELFEIHAAVEELEFEVAHAALVDEFNIVRKVIVIPYCNNNDTDVTDFCNGIGLPGRWLDTAYLGSRRGKYAAIGDHYDPVANVFYTPTHKVPDEFDMQANKAIALTRKVVNG